jgi:hypothetical protein
VLRRGHVRETQIWAGEELLKTYYYDVGEFKERRGADQKTNLGGVALAAGAIALAGGLIGAWKNRRGAKPRFHRSMTDAMVDLMNFGYWNEGLNWQPDRPSLPQLREYAGTKAELDWDRLPDSARQNLASMPATQEAVRARLREIALMPGYAQLQAEEELKDRVRHLFPTSLAELERQDAAYEAAQAADREAERLRRSSEEESRKRAAKAARPMRTPSESIPPASTPPEKRVDPLSGAVKVWQSATAANYATQRAILEGRW